MSQRFRNLFCQEESYINFMGLTRSLLKEKSRTGKANMEIGL